MELSRPGPIFGVCVVWAAYTAYPFYRFLNADLSAFPSWFASYYVIITATALLGVIGIFMMRKWGLAVFALCTVIDQGMLFSQQQWHIFSLLLPMMVIMVAIAHLEDMR